MRRLIAWTLILTAGALVAVAPARGQATSPAAKKQAPAATAPAPAATKPAAAPLDANAVKAQQLAQQKAMDEMNQILADWEKQSKKVMSLYVEFDRVDRSKAWGNEYFQGQAILKSPDKACLEFKKVKVDANNKPVEIVDASGKKVFALEKDPDKRIVCTGTEVLQYEWANKVVYVYPLDKETRQKALQEGPLPFLFNMKAAEARARYGMRLMQKSATEFLISVVPNEDIDKESFSRAFVYLDRTTFQPNKLFLYPVQNGGGGQPKEVQEFTFRNIQPNRVVADAFFNPVLQMPGWEVKRNPAEGGDQLGPVNPGRPAGPRRADPGKAATRPVPTPR